MLQCEVASLGQIEYFVENNTAALIAFWQSHTSSEMQGEMFKSLSLAEMCVVLRVLADHIDMR